MKFHTLEIENFLTIGKAKIAMDDRGLHVIQGENKTDSSANSNGSGKSSMVDALSWALFGVTARGVKGDSVVNRKEKKNTKVSLMLSNGVTVYEVTRYRKHKEHKNALHLLLKGTTHGETAVLTKGTDAETQKEVERILGCSKEVFLASVYLGQEMMPDIPAMTDRELKSLVEEAAGLQRIELAYQEARQRLQVANGFCQNLQIKHEEIRMAIARVVGNIEHQRGLLGKWDEDRAGVIDSYQRQVEEARRMHAEAAATAAAASGKRDGLVAAQVKLSEGLSGHKGFTDAAAAAQRVLNTLQAEFNMLKRQAQVIQQDNEKDLELVNQVLAGGFDSKPCTTCGALPDPAKAQEHREHMLQSTRDRAERSKQALANATEAVRMKGEAVKHAQVNAEAASAAVPDVSAVNTKLAQINEALTRISTLVNAARGAENALRMAEGNLATHSAQTNPYVAIVTTLEKDELDTRKRMEETSALYDKEKARYNVLDAVVQLYGPAGVRAQILDTVTPYLNERTADYLSALSDGNITAVWSTLSRTSAGAIREKFAIEVNHAQGGDSFASISGGEKRKVRLACALALQDLVASRATQPLDLFIGDEIDDALDVSGLERLMTILERKARDKGTVLVISHNDLSDWCDQVTTVSKVSEQTSEVTGSLCV